MEKEEVCLKDNNGGEKNQVIILHKIHSQVVSYHTQDSRNNTNSRLN